MITDNATEEFASLDGSLNSVNENSILKIRTQRASLDQPYKSKSAEKVVQFSMIEIHSHVVQLGDNPSVSQGPPITISWEAFDSQILPLDNYENNKPMHRQRQELLIPRFVREDWLREQGFSRGEISQVLNEISRTQQCRARNSKDGLIVGTLRLLNKGFSKKVTA